jgi:hypothetical protein
VQILSRRGYEIHFWDWRSLRAPGRLATWRGCARQTRLRRLTRKGPANSGVVLPGANLTISSLVRGSPTWFRKEKSSRAIPKPQDSGALAGRGAGDRRRLHERDAEPRATVLDRRRYGPERQDRRARRPHRRGAAPPTRPDDPRRLRKRRSRPGGRRSPLRWRRRSGCRTYSTCSAYTVANCWPTWCCRSFGRARSRPVCA